MPMWLRGHMAVSVDQHVGGSQQLSRRDPTGSCVEPAVNNFGMAECQLHLLEEIINHLETIGLGDKQLNRKRISNVFYSAVFCNNFFIAFFS